MPFLSPCLVEITVELDDCGQGVGSTNKVYDACGAKCNVAPAVSIEFSIQYKVVPPRVSFRTKSNLALVFQFDLSPPYSK